MSRLTLNRSFLNRCIAQTPAPSVPACNVWIASRRYLPCFHEVVTWQSLENSLGSLTGYLMGVQVVSCLNSVPRFR